LFESNFESELEALEYKMLVLNILCAIKFVTLSVTVLEAVIWMK